jgi:hypothetical protein
MHYVLCFQLLIAKCQRLSVGSDNGQLSQSYVNNNTVGQGRKSIILSSTCKYSHLYDSEMSHKYIVNVAVV